MHSSEQNHANAVDAQPADNPQVDCHVVALTHYLPPYMSSVLSHIAGGLRQFSVLLSIQQEPNRDFGETWEGLEVHVQKSIMLRRNWKHADGQFQDKLYVHIPYDTFSRLRKLNPDIVFSYELGFRSLISAIYCKLYRKKLALCVCVSERTEQGRGKLRWLLRKILLKLADAISYNGPSCLAYLQRFDVPQHKLFHFPYACSEKFKYQGAIQRQESADRRLLCVGQLIQRKGVVPLVEGLMEYCQLNPSRDVELDFVGKGDQQDKLCSFQLPENLRINYLGHLDYRQMAQAMEKTGVLVFPTLADEWGLVVNEAFAAGMPVIGSQYAQACTTLIDEGVTGWQYFPDQPQTLYKALDAMFDLSNEDMHAMRNRCVTAVADITPANVADGAVRVFRRLNEVTATAR